MSSSSVFNSITDFYNGYGAIAERVERKKLQDMHISTPLDDAIGNWVRKRKDVILTGNPGDGKTHLINILQYSGLLAPAYTEKDASQRDTKAILQTWKQKKQENVPFLLAINHAPLRNLAREAAIYPGIEHLQYIPDEIDNLIYYNEAAESKLPNTIVLDLSQREIITNSIIRGIADRFCKEIASSPCTDCPPKRCPVEYNAAAIAHARILGNLMEILTLVTRRGLHITMRDLIGLFAYILTGGEPCATRWQPSNDDSGNTSPPIFEDYAYYNLLFQGRSHLFDAIRDTFDPAQYSDPQSDSQLWAGTLRESWLLSEPTVAPPANLKELRVLKRRYFFEHDHDTGELLKRMLPATEYNFNSLIKSSHDDPSEVEELVGMINLLYAPIRIDQRTDQHYRLRLWNSHRYSVGSVPGFFAMRSIPADNLALYLPKAAPQIANVLEVRQDHVLLGVQRWQPGDPGLRVDWPMYQALTAAYNGTPIDIQPFHILRRLDLFLRSLGSDAGGPRHIENVEWSNHRHRKSISIRINRTNECYEQERI